MKDESEFSSWKVCSAPTISPFGIRFWVANQVAIGGTQIRDTSYLNGRKEIPGAALFSFKELNSTIQNPDAIVPNILAVIQEAHFAV